MDIQKIVGQYLIDAGQKILDGTCSMSQEEINHLASTIIHKELNKTEAAELLNMSVRNFDRHIEKGDIPAGQTKRGSKQLIWYEDELLL